MDKIEPLVNTVVEDKEPTSPVQADEKAVEQAVEPEVPPVVENKQQTEQTEQPYDRRQNVVLREKVKDDATILELAAFLQGVYNVGACTMYLYYFMTQMSLRPLSCAFVQTKYMRWAAMCIAGPNFICTLFVLYRFWDLSRRLMLEQTYSDLVFACGNLVNLFALQVNVWNIEYNYDIHVIGFLGFMVLTPFVVGFVFHNYVNHVINDRYARFAKVFGAFEMLWRSRVTLLISFIVFLLSIFYIIVMEFPHFPHIQRGFECSTENYYVMMGLLTGAQFACFWGQGVFVIYLAYLTYAIDLNFYLHGTRFFTVKPVKNIIQKPQPYEERSSEEDHDKALQSASEIYF